MELQKQSTEEPKSNTIFRRSKEYMWAKYWIMVVGSQ